MCSSVLLERCVVVPSHASVVANASLHARVALCQVCGASDVKRVHVHDCQSKHMHMVAMHVTQVWSCNPHRHTKTCAHGYLDTAKLSVNGGAAGGVLGCTLWHACMHACMI
jgi:hypothetical protein